MQRVRRLEPYSSRKQVRWQRSAGDQPKQRRHAQHAAYGGEENRSRGPLHPGRILLSNHEYIGGRRQRGEQNRRIDPYRVEVAHGAQSEIHHHRMCDQFHRHDITQFDRHPLERPERQRHAHGKQGAGRRRLREIIDQASDRQRRYEFDPCSGHPHHGGEDEGVKGNLARHPKRQSAGAAMIAAGERHHHRRDGEMHNVKMSNSERKMALRNVLDVLGKHYPELSVDDKLNFMTTHAKDFYSGDIDPYNEDEIKDEYEEYSTLNNRMEESYATVVNKIKKTGKSDKAAKAIAGAVASYKAKGGGKGPTVKQK